VTNHEPCTETGFIKVLEADMALLAKCDPASAEHLAREALHLARAIPNVGVEVVALAILGSALVASGSAEEGLSRLDEANIGRSRSLIEFWHPQPDGLAGASSR